MNAFIAMPFGDEIANNVYQFCVRPVCQELNLEMVRSDEILTPSPIIDEIVEAIHNAAVVIVDVSGLNPNVFYELGMAHIIKPSRTITITHDPYDRLPFDIAHLRVIKYENTISGKTAFESQLRCMIKNILEDRLSLFRDEFEAILTLMKASEDLPKIYALLGIAKAPRPLPRDDKIIVRGHYDKTHHVMAGSILEEFGSFIALGYVDASNEFIILTEKGKAFTSFVERKGLVCDYLNDFVFSPEFEADILRLSFFGKLKDGEHFLMKETNDDDK